MISLSRQEAYRQRYGDAHPEWQPSSQVYQDMVAARLDRQVRALDLGCGRGGVMERLHAGAGWVSGLDPDLKSLADHRAPALSLVQGLSEALPYASGTFDLVCCSWVLEHLSDPRATFAEIGRVLTRGGHFIFLTPNARHPLVAFNRALSRSSTGWVKRVYGREEADTFPALYRANTLAAIQQHAAAAGLRPTVLRTVGDPSYLALNEPLYRLACLLERLTPASLRVHLLGEFVAD
jgi:SAM-dependent methyltransferase